MTDTPNLQPTLRGERLLLRPIADTDWADLFAAAADPKIWEQHPDADRYTEPVFRRFFEDALASGSAFVIVDQQTGKLIGSSRYYGHDADAREIEIGWTFLSRDYWGGSYNHELKTLMVDHALTVVDTVVFRVDESNQRSRRAMEKIGGKLRDGVYFKEGSEDRPYVVYELKNAPILASASQ